MMSDMLRRPDDHGLHDVGRSAEADAALALQWLNSTRKPSFLFDLFIIHKEMATIVLTTLLAAVGMFLGLTALD